MRVLKILSFTLLSILVLACNETKRETKISEAEVIESYVYLLGRALAVRQEKTDLSEEGIEYNSIKYNEAGKADFVNPNLDVAYMEAWFAMDEKSAILLTIPKIENRLLIIRMLIFDRSHRKATRNLFY